MKKLALLVLLPVCSYAQPYVVVTDATPTVSLHQYWSGKLCGSEARHQATVTGKNAYCIPMSKIKCSVKEKWDTETGHCKKKGA